MSYSSAQRAIGPEQAQKMRSHIYEVSRQLDGLIGYADNQEQRDREVTEKRVREVLRARRRRDEFFDADLFADPAWDILLELYAAELSQRRVTVGSITIGAAVPMTTALRWIKAMESRGLIIRQEDPIDRRRIFLSLGLNASEAMAEYFRSERVS